MPDTKDESLEERLRSLDLEEYFESVIIQRGIQYYNEGRVRNIVFSSEQIIGTVRGQNRNYQVTLGLYRQRGNSFLHFTCTCPYGNYCKHMVAVVLKAQELHPGWKRNSSQSETRGTKDPKVNASSGLDSSLRTPHELEDGRGDKNEKETPYSRLMGFAQALQKVTSSLGRRSGPGEHFSKQKETRNIKGVILGLLSAPYYPYESFCTLGVYKVTVSNWRPLAELAATWPLEVSLEEFWKQVRLLFQEDSSWVGKLDQLNLRKREAEEWGLTEAGLGAVNLLSQYQGLNYRSVTVKGTILTLLFSTGVPLYFFKKHKEPASGPPSRKDSAVPLQMIPETLRMGIRIQHEAGGVKLEGILLPSMSQGAFPSWTDGQPTTSDPGIDPLEGIPLREGILKVASDPDWYMANGKVFRVLNEEVLSLLSGWSMDLSPQETERFRLEMLPDLTPVLPVFSPLLVVNRVEEKPVPRVYLSEDELGLRMELRFLYAGHEVGASEHPEGVVTPMEKPWQYTFLLRDQKEEKKWADWFLSQNLGLKKAPKPDPPGTYRLKKKVHPVDVLLHLLPRLEEEGVEVFGEEGLVHARVNRHRPIIWMSVKSGIDWFDLKGGARFGDAFCGLKEIIQAVQRKERYVKLGDGSLGVLPMEWIHKFETLESFGQWQEESLRFHTLHAPLVEHLDTTEEVMGLEGLRSRLSQFRRIDPVPLPKDFFGTLRPYQVHGYRWLHFLRAGKVGGILADDMGLGKTIQVLAYLQSLKETDPPTRAHLLVVPKSLVYNWQSEASRFTPGVRFLEYLGQGRTEYVEEFDAYDVVITTYATMLRDIEKLKDYPFHHVILDESQVIKNPLAQSNRAARSLQAEHRLVLTGTPMENNIIELWSQFAFLEPALFGPLHRFKRTLGNRVERGDKHALEVVKTLIYPFLLRRTKEQVAPELPPRIEETLYAEMGREQEKLYHAVREQFRLEIKELLNSEEPWRARTKILEGLLRLRQIAIHPLLYEGRKRFESAKFILLLDVLSTLREEGHRALVFSQFVEALKLLRKELEAQKIPYAYLDGQTQKRKEEVERFQADSVIPFFLISLKAGGTGLNLTAADYVLLLDPWWNPAVEAQAADRTHRIGQDKPVLVYRFITRGTVEEKILLLQEKKRDIVSSVIRNDAGIFKSLNQEDIEALFTR